MNPDKPFSSDYNIQEGTSTPKAVEDIEEPQDVLKEIEDKYAVSKPRRNIIRARIISPHDKSKKK